MTSISNNSDTTRFIKTVVVMVVVVMLVVMVVVTALLLVVVVVVVGGGFNTTSAQHNKHSGSICSKLDNYPNTLFTKLLIGRHKNKTIHYRAAVYSGPKTAYNRDTKAYTDFIQALYRDNVCIYGL